MIAIHQRVVCATMKRIHLVDRAEQWLRRTIPQQRSLQTSSTHLTTDTTTIVNHSLPPIARPLPSLPSTPLRICILGGGLTGLTVAHQLQRQLREVGRQQVEIVIQEKQPRSGGWIRSEKYDSASGKSYLIERGPRSFIYRPSEDYVSETTLELLRQLQLGDQVIFADRSAAKRFVWNRTSNQTDNSADGKLVLMPGDFSTLWNYPHRSALIKGVMHEWSCPKLDPPEDESVASFITRRFNSTITDNIIDPMMAGIYAGSPDKLSLASCFGRLQTMECRSGGILRDMFAKPTAVKQELAAKYVKRLDEIEQHRTSEPDWMAQIKRLRTIYSLRGGMSTLTRALVGRLQSDANDPYAKYLPDCEAKVTLSQQSSVTGLRINDQNKPILQVTHSNGSKQEDVYDHVFSTLPSFELHSILASPTTALPLTPTDRSRLLNLLAPQSMPFTSVWAVNLIYDHAILTPDKRGFGLLIPSKHVSPGLEGVIGITFDSCVFPDQNLQGENETRLTVMIGGDRYPELHSASKEDMEILALKAVQQMLGIHPLEHRPIYVDGLLNHQCIPQYYVGHGQKTYDAFELLRKFTYLPSSHKFPLHIKSSSPASTPISSSSTSDTTHHPLTILGTSFCGVSLSDCIHHGTAAATDFVKREIQAASPTTSTAQ